VRCGAVRCGAVRCGAVRCGAVRGGAVRCGAVRCGAVRCGAVRCGAVRCGAVRCGAVERRQEAAVTAGPRLQNGARTLNRSRASSPQSIKAIQENGKDGKSGSLSIHSILSRSCPKTNIMHCIVSGAPNSLFLWEPRGALGNLWEPFGAFRSSL
jgi:hypothetical protein